MFAHSPDDDGRGGGRHRGAAAGPAGPSSARTSPTSPRSPRPPHEAGAEAVTLVNTLLGMAIDLETRRPVLGGGGGGLSGPAIHPVAVRAVHDVHAALPDLPIVGVGGVRASDDAVELLLAGASAVQVGTATFADPRAAGQVLAGLEHWCDRHGVAARRRADRSCPCLTTEAAVTDDTATISRWPSTSTTSSRPSGWPACCGPGSAWPRSASSCTAPPGPMAVSALQRARLRGVLRPQAARHPDHGERAASRPRRARGAATSRSTPPGASPCSGPASRASGRGATAAGWPEPGGAGRHRPHERAGCARPHPRPPGRRRGRGRLRRARVRGRRRAPRPSSSRPGCSRSCPASARPGAPRHDQARAGHAGATPSPRAPTCW